MRHIFIMLFLFSLLSSCEKRLTINEVNIAGDGLFYYQGKPFTGQVFDLHKNGKLKIEMEFKDGKKNGVVRNFNDQEVIIEEQIYDNGVKHGRFIKYFHDGTLEYEKFYVRDTLDGQYIVNQDKFNGIIATYKMGNLDGYFKSINPYGDEEGTYQNNLKVGVWKKYDYYKRLISENEYKKGILDGIWRTYDPDNGLVVEEGLHKNGRYINKGKEKYKSVKIGTQTWMAENLNSTLFQNGDTISTVNYQYYRNNPQEYAKKYGVFYNWEAVVDSRNICPSGWRIPTKSDWELLLSYLGENAFKKLKSSYDWERFYGTSGTNESGMNVLPVGDNSAFFWSGTEFDEGNAWGIGFGHGEYIAHTSKNTYQTCRCIMK